MKESDKLEPFNNILKRICLIKNDDIRQIFFNNIIVKSERLFEQAKLPCTPGNICYTYTLGYKIFNKYSMDVDTFEGIHCDLY